MFQPRASSLAIVVAWALATGSPVLAQAAPPAVDPFWSVPDIGSLPDDDHGRLVRRGRDLITATYAHIGPAVADPAKRYAGNNLACRNCHLDAGMKKFGNPLWGLAGRFPQYDAETGTTITIEQRINACMTRSMNGRPLPLDAPEMKAMTAYVSFLSTGVQPGETLTGYGAGQMPELDRPADPERGRAVFRETCAACHGENGQGLRRNPSAAALGYMVPPLWGPDSFNDAAGMNRLTTIANFVHFNMPNGVSYVLPRLSLEDAWDVAAFVVSQPRPRKAGLDKDFPTCCRSRWIRPMAPMRTGSAASSMSTAPSGRSAPNWLA